MEPITGATTFATVVSLVADFVARREANETKDFDAFMAWLQEQRHEELRAQLQSSAGTVVSIKALLSESRTTILERLTSLDQMLSTVAASIPAFQDLAQLARPVVTLSHQAVSVLEQFYDSGASGLLESKRLDGVVLAFLDGAGGSIQFDEPRFIEDDLTGLVKLGLLDLAHNGRGERIFKFKRVAAALVEQRRAS